MVTSGVRICSICRTEVVTNTKRNLIPVERDMGSFCQNYYLITNPVNPSFHDHISIQNAWGLFPSRNKIIRNVYCSEETVYLCLQKAY